MCLDLEGGKAFCGERCPGPRNSLLGRQHLNRAFAALYHAHANLSELYRETPAEETALHHWPATDDEFGRESTIPANDGRAHWPGLLRTIVALKRIQRNLVEFYRERPMLPQDDDTWSEREADCEQLLEV